MCPDEEVGREALSGARGVVWKEPSVASGLGCEMRSQVMVATAQSQCVNRILQYVAFCVYFFH